MSAVATVLAEQVALLRPPPRRRLSEWGDAKFVMSRESSASPGRWRSYPPQREILDAMTDPRYEQVSVQKSSRVGATKGLCILIAYHIDEDPCPILLFQPTVDDARRFSRKEIAPMVRDVPCLRGKVSEPRSRDSSNTILDKEFVGGSLELLGANSPAGFRARTVRVLIFDEVDAYRASAGAEGDPIALGIRRTETYWNRKIVAVSTPAEEPSRIERLYLDGDQRRYYVPCPHCGHFDELVFQKGEDGHGHWMWWPEGKPEQACFYCSSCGCEIGHEHKRDMVARGEWRANAVSPGHASFFIWAAYSFSPNATWAQIATEYEKAEAARREGRDEEMTAFTNTWLGQPKRVVGESPAWEPLYRRRETYSPGTVPAGVQVLTAGVDVQGDRLVYEVVGWGARKESWSIEIGTIAGKTDAEDGPAWKGLTDLMAKSWPGADGRPWVIAMLGIDSGYNTSAVYAWGHQDPTRRLVVKGMGEDKATARMLLGVAQSSVLKGSGKIAARRCLVWPVGSGLAKKELYGWLKLEPPTHADDPFPAGWCHFPEWGEDYFQQLTAEQLVEVHDKHGRPVHVWEIKKGHQNHHLDARVYARAAAARIGVDQLVEDPARSRPKPGPRPAPSAPTADGPPIPRSFDSRPGGWLGGRGFGGRRGNWLGQ